MRASLGGFALVLACVVAVPLSAAAQAHRPAPPSSRNAASCLHCVHPAGVQRISRGAVADPVVLEFQRSTLPFTIASPDLGAISDSDAPSRRFWGALLGATVGAGAGLLLGAVVGNELAPCGPEGPCLGAFGGAIVGGVLGAIFGGLIGAHIADDRDPTSSTGRQN